MTAKVIHKKVELDIREGTTMRTTLEMLGIQPEAIIPTINGELVDDGEIINDGGNIRLVSVISGG
jgi:sulfur carrier protein ThiS